MPIQQFLSFKFPCWSPTYKLVLSTNVFDFGFFKVSIGIKDGGEGSYYPLPMHGKVDMCSTENKETDKIIILYYFIVHYNVLCSLDN